jgi:hypothetical protein
VLARAVRRGLIVCLTHFLQLGLRCEPRADAEAALRKFDANHFGLAPQGVRVPIEQVLDHDVDARAELIGPVGDEGETRGAQVLRGPGVSVDAHRHLRRKALRAPAIIARLQRNVDRDPWGDHALLLA